tara:strand:+ start:148 stop:501 length:354 start_codon:yes stop_codon:yes gene_type:complete
MYTFQIIKIIFSIGVVIITSYLLPWWILSIITFIIGYISNKELEAAASGFLIGFLSWLLVLVYLFYSNNNIIFVKMSLLLNMNSPFILIISTSILSGLLGMVSSWSGWQFNKRKNYD